MSNNTDNMHVKDPNAAIASCDSADKIISSLNQNTSELSSLLSKIETTWSSDGLDQQSYMQNFSTQTKRLESLIANMQQVFAVIRNYSTSVQQASSTTLDAVVGESIGDYKVGTGYRTSADSVNKANGVNLNTKYINSDNSQVKGFAVLDENGKVTDRITEKGVSVADYAAQHNISTDRIAVDISNKDGVSQAWVSASDFE